MLIQAATRTNPGNVALSESSHTEEPHTVTLLVGKIRGGKSETAALWLPGKRDEGWSRLFTDWCFGGEDENVLKLEWRWLHNSEYKRATNTLQG